MAISLYIETSVPSMYYSWRLRSLAETTRKFWSLLGRFKGITSDLTLEELRATKNSEKRERLLELIKQLKTLPIPDSALNLAEIYVKEKIFDRRQIRDATHYATSTLFEVDALVTWNYRHLAKYETIHAAKQINTKEGYKEVDVVTPKNFV